VGLVLLVAGAAALLVDRTQRDAAGFLSFGSESFATAGFAVDGGPMDLRQAGWGPGVDRLVGTVRVQVTPADPGRLLFLGIARTADAARYLEGVRHATFADLPFNGRIRVDHPGGPPRQLPETADIWVAQSVGTGPQSVTWRPRDGSWTIVTMNQDAVPGIAVRVRAAATVPLLDDVAAGLLVAGALGMLTGVAMVVVPALRASRTERRP
ncbi:MAG: DUF4389 domain-containing protein, partial [Actinomycetes bacterium]